MGWLSLDSWEQIDRADAKGKELAQRWADFCGDDPYTAIVKPEDDRTGTILVDPRYAVLPPTFRLLFGEILYHLAAALDACIYSAAFLDSGRAVPAEPEKLEFPIIIDGRDFNKTARKLLGPIDKKRWPIIESVQPGNAPNVRPDERFINEHLRLLYWLPRWDRHRELRVVGSWASGASPLFRLPPGVELAWLHVERGGLLEDQSRVARFGVSERVRWEEVQANPNLFIDIALNEAVPAYIGSYLLGDIVPGMVDAVTAIRTKLDDSFRRE